MRAPQAYQGDELFVNADSHLRGEVDRDGLGCESVTAWTLAGDMANYVSL
ncbi:MAG: hypothetical protein QOH91_174 [Mycobacterium sp.]|jgi:hypothetical protein|nr:hypothetical protein [Mycobacterium sp.]